MTTGGDIYTHTNIRREMRTGEKGSGMKEKTAFASEGFKNPATDRIEYSRPGKRPAPIQVLAVEMGAEPPEYLYRESDDWAAKYAPAYARYNGKIIYGLVGVKVKP